MPSLLLSIESGQAQKTFKIPFVYNAHCTFQRISRALMNTLSSLHRPRVRCQPLNTKMYVYAIFNSNLLSSTPCSLHFSFDTLTQMLPFTCVWTQPVRKCQAPPTPFLPAPALDHPHTPPPLCVSGRGWLISSFLPPSWSLHHHTMQQQQQSYYQ